MTYSLRDLAAGAGIVLETELLPLAGTSITLASLLVFVAIILVTFRVSKWLQSLLGVWFRQRGLAADGTLGAMRRLLHYTVIIVGFGISLQTVGINLGALFAAGAVFAVGIGFAMQNIAQNFVAGFILLLERTIKPGDILEVDGRVVRVLQMNIRSTIVRTRDGEDLIVPNANLVQSTVTNLTLTDSAIRLRAMVGVHYDSDMHLVRSTLENLAREIPWRDQLLEPQVFLKQFGSSSVDWEVSVWAAKPWNSRRDLSLLHEAIWDALKQAGVTIAFPQVDVHLDTPVVQAMTEGPRLVE